MLNDSFVATKIRYEREEGELEEFKRLLKLKRNISGEEIIIKWNSLRKMQNELEIPSLHPIKQHYYFHQKLIEIQTELDLPFTDFVQLNQLYIEFKALRSILGLHDTTPISDIIPLFQMQYNMESKDSNIGSDSLLYKILLFHKISPQKKPADKQVRSAIEHNIDRVLFEILVSYGPLSRSELVQLTGKPRTSIYDSLKRLMLKGFVVKQYEKRSATGRPTTLFDVLI